jgi:putative transposase
MPRGPRLDAPGALHHVIARGIERTNIFRDDRDRQALVDRMHTLLPATGTTLYAWSLLSNHLHLLMRSGPAGLCKVMQRLLGGYVTTFNRRHHRCGHLFQNRFKSTLVEEDTYLLTLVRYIHLNPLRAGLVENLDALARDRWSGHPVLLGRRSFAAQDVEFVLRQFGPTPARARRAYRDFLRDGLDQPESPDLDGGGLRRSAGGWETLDRLTRGRERWAGDERVLGTSTFVEQVITRELQSRRLSPAAADPALIASLCTDIARRWSVSSLEIASASRRHNVVLARALVSFVAVRRYGLSLTAVARGLHISKQTVFRGLALAEQILPLVQDTIGDLLPADDALARGTTHP